VQCQLVEQLILGHPESVAEGAVHAEVVIDEGQHSLVYLREDWEILAQEADTGNW
jgi:hypothetical protein